MKKRHRLSNFGTLLFCVLAFAKCTQPDQKPAAELPQIEQKEVEYLAKSLQSLIPDSAGFVWLHAYSVNSTVKVHRDKVRCLKIFIDWEDPSFPMQVFQFQNLRRLWVGMRGFKTLPPEIAQLQKLEEIDFQHGSLETLPDEFCQLKNLREASFLFSGLKTLPDCFGDLENLEYLNLNFTKVTRFPDSMKRLKKLRKIYISKTPKLPKVSEAERQKLKGWLPNCDVWYIIEDVD